VAIRHGRIYIAPSNRHMMLTRGHIRLTLGAPENRHRPAIDPLFRSAALAYGPRVVGILLSGSLDDGTAGLRAIKACRGVTMVQDPAQARYPGMAEHALMHAQIDYCASVEKLARLIEQHAAEPAIDPDNYEPPEHLKLEVEFAFMEGNMDQMKRLGPPSEFVCPTCHGSLTEIRDGDMLRYRCHTGHAFSAENLFLEQDRAVEEALFTAVRAIEENAALARRIAGTYGGRFPQQQAAQEDKARRLEQSALTLRKLIVGRNDRNVEASGK
jgi:two-component system chemotaxis response regulator CheB